MSPTTLGTLALLLPLATPPQEDAAGNWPHWRGPNRDGVSTETSWSSTGAEEDLWRAEVGLGYSNVSIVGDRLYTIGFFEEDGIDVVSCRNALTGEAIWDHAYPSKKWDNMHEGGSLSTPVIDGERVYVMSRLGTLMCLEAESGAVLFERELIATEPELGFFGLAASPLVLDEALVLNPGRTIAVDKQSGKTLWQTKDYGYSYSVPTPFELDGKPLLAVFNGSGLAVLDRKDGKELALHPWTSNYNVNAASPIVIGNRIFLSTGYDAIGCALLEFTGERLEVVWESKAMSNYMNGCVLVDGHLYGFDESVLKCLSLEGEVLWSERGLGRGTVVAAGDRLIVLSEEGELIIAPANTEIFEPASRTKLFEQGACWTTPVLVGGRIYCRNNRGELVCRDHRGKS